MFAEGVILLLSSLGVIQALFLCLYLFSLKERRSNVLLALLLLTLVVRVGKSVLHAYVPIDPRIRNLAISGMLTMGPLLWFYGKVLLEKYAFSRRDYLHLIPFTLFALLSPVIPNRGDAPSIIIYWLVLLQVAGYLVGCWMYTLRTASGNRLLPWYRTIVIGISLIWFLYVGGFVGFIPFYLLVAGVFSLLVYVFSYMLLKRHIFTLEKYTSSTIDPAASRQLLQQVKNLFEQKAVYLNSDISLKGVADILSVNARDLSQVINEHEGRNFSEFVNQYRLAKAKVVLADARYGQEKIASIAYDCGFGNVTSFNLAFKAATQLTPSQYRNQFPISKTA
jgi:AraC-like DNA-binding protein